jgi:hypothetical protein
MTGQNITLMAPLERRIISSFLCFFFENELIPVKFLYDSYEIPAFQRRPETEPKWGPQSKSFAANSTN